MLTVEVLMRAAEGDGASVRSVAEEVRRVGWPDWVSEAIRARIDPLLAVAVLPAPARVEVARALVVFYGNWGGCFPREYRRVRREWRVLRDRWLGGGRARAYGELLAAVGAPAPALARSEAASSCTRAASAFVAAAEDRETGRSRPAAGEESAAVSGGGTGGEATNGSGMARGLGLDEPLAAEDAVRDAAAKGGGEADAGDAPARGETDAEGAGDVIGGAVNGVQPGGTRVIPEIGPEVAVDGPWVERLRSAADRERSVVVRLRDAWLGSERDFWFAEWLEPAVSRSRERVGR